MSVFSVHGDQLSLRQVINSGGQFPVSVAVHGFNVYVLNALSANVQGYISFSDASSRSPIRIGAWGSQFPTTRTSSQTPPGRWQSRRTGPS